MIDSPSTTSITPAPGRTYGLTAANFNFKTCVFALTIKNTKVIAGAGNVGLRANVNGTELIDGATTKTVTGSGFVSGSVVRWNGANRTTTFVSATQLTASITAADIATAGTAQVTVFNPTPGGGTSGQVSFPVTANNPVPTLSTLSPTSATAGVPADSAQVRIYYWDAVRRGAIVVTESFSRRFGVRAGGRVS